MHLFDTYGLGNALFRAEAQTDIDENKQGEGGIAAALSNTRYLPLVPRREVDLCSCLEQQRDGADLVGRGGGVESGETPQVLRILLGPWGF